MIGVFEPLWVECRSAQASDLAADRRLRGDAESLTYNVTSRIWYPIAALLIYEGVLLGVTRNDAGRPSTVPMGLFAPSVTVAPVGWRLAFRTGLRLGGPASWENPLGMIAGYDEIVDDDGHLDDLLSGETHAVSIFQSLVERDSRSI